MDYTLTASDLLDLVENGPPSVRDAKAARTFRALCRDIEAHPWMGKLLKSPITREDNPYDILLKKALTLKFPDANLRYCIAPIIGSSIHRVIVVYSLEPSAAPNNFAPPVIVAWNATTSPDCPRPLFNRSKH